MCSNSIIEPSESVLLASNLPRLSEDSKMLRAGTWGGFRLRERENEEAEGKKKASLAPLDFSIEREKKKKQLTHPHAERDLGPRLGQGLGDGPAKALVVGDAGDEGLLAWLRS